MSNYWQKRFQAVEEMNNKRAKETVRSVTPAFDKAQAQIEKEINAWYARFAKNNEITLQEAKKLLNTRELKEFRWDVQEYIKYGRQNAIDQQWMKQLENASSRFHISRLEALKIRTQNAAERAFGNELDQIDEMAARMYTDGYYHTAYEIQRGLGIGWDVSKIDQRKVDNIISKPWTADKMTFSDRIWKSKTQLLDSLQTELTQMCILGKEPDQAIRNIANRMNVSKGQAGRLIMTEAAYFGSAAQKDCFNDLDVEKYEIIATLDNRTSEVCREMDGKVFDMKDFQAGVTAPPFHVWCRSCTAPWFEDNDDGTRAARDADGKTYQVPASMKYEDWKEHFVDKTKDPADWLKPIDNRLTIGNTKYRISEEKHTFTNGSWDASSDPKFTRDAKVYELDNGMRIYVPKDLNAKYQRMTPEHLIELLDEVPSNIKTHMQRSIEILDYYNPVDSYWKKHYKGFTHSYMTGGDEIAVYRYMYDHSDDYFITSLCHETGHKIDRDFSNISESSDWKTAMAEDKKLSGKKSWRKYGENSVAEDFADSIGYYSWDTENFKSIFPNRTAIIERILKGGTP